jgi:hypothetical protein
MLLSDRLQHLPSQCNHNLSWQYSACCHIPTRLTCAFPQCYLITSAHQITLAYMVLPLLLVAPLCLPLVLRGIKTWLDPAGTSLNNTNIEQTIHNTTIVHHHGTATTHPTSSDLPPYHYAHVHARLPMPLRRLRVLPSRSAQAALKSRSTSTTSKTSSMGTSSFAPIAPPRPPPPSTSTPTSPPRHPGTLAVNDGPLPTCLSGMLGPFLHLH